MAETALASWEDLTFRAMGSRCRILVGGGAPGLPQRLVDRVAALESVWTRFRADSEVSRINAAPGRHVFVGPDTLKLLVHAVSAWELTDGWFDPLMLNELEDAGYDRDHRELQSVPVGDPLHPSIAGVGPTTDTARRSPMAELDVDEVLGSVTLPPGTRFDPGGIGKGLAADMVADEAMAAGAEFVLVDLGGDMRLGGPWVDGGAWPCLVGHPGDLDRELAEIEVAGGALATSGRRRRRWQTGDGEVHHLLDPRSGRPSESRLVSVTVHAGAAWYAEALAKAALLAGPGEGRELIEKSATAALFVDAHDHVDIVGPLRVSCLTP